MTNKMEERYEGNYLDALDLPEGALVPVTIESIVEPFAEKDSAGRPIKSAILSFVGKKKRLILNRTNWKNLKAQFGRDPKEWTGKQINIQRRYLDAAHGFGTNNTLAIRIIPPIGTPILISAARYMGSMTPYGQDKQTKKPKTEAPPKAPELSQWLGGVKVLESMESCAEFRQSVLPTCPEPVRAQVERALAAKEKSLADNTD